MARPSEESAPAPRQSHQNMNLGARICALAERPSDVATRDVDDGICATPFRPCQLLVLVFALAIEVRLSNQEAPKAVGMEGACFQTRLGRRETRAVVERLRGGLVVMRGVSDLERRIWGQRGKHT